MFDALQRLEHAFSCLYACNFTKLLAYRWWVQFKIIIFLWCHVLNFDLNEKSQWVPSGDVDTNVLGAGPSFRRWIRLRWHKPFSFVMGLYWEKRKPWFDAVMVGVRYNRCWHVFWDGKGILICRLKQVVLLTFSHWLLAEHHILSSTAFGLWQCLVKNIFYF